MGLHMCKDARLAVVKRPERVMGNMHTEAKQYCPGIRIERM